MTVPEGCSVAQCWNCRESIVKCKGPTYKQMDDDSSFEEICRKVFPKEQIRVIDRILKEHPEYYSSYREVISEIINRVVQEMECEH